MHLSSGHRATLLQFDCPDLAMGRMMDENANQPQRAAVPGQA
jgi:hypothetical protein